MRIAFEHDGIVYEGHRQGSTIDCTSCSLWEQGVDRLHLCNEEAFDLPRKICIIHVKQQKGFIWRKV